MAVPDSRSAKLALREKLPKTEAQQIMEILYWLNEIWLDDDLRQQIDEKQLQQFIETLETMLEQ